jgi:integrase
MSTLSIDTYTTLSSKRGAPMSDSYTFVLLNYGRPFLDLMNDNQADTPIAIRSLLAEYIPSLRTKHGTPYSNGSKAVIASALTRYLEVAGLLRKEDAELVRSLFRSPYIVWSEKEITSEALEQVIVNALRSHGTNEHPYEGLRRAALYTFMASLGCRISEALLLMPEDVSIADDCMTVRIVEAKKITRVKVQKQIPMSAVIGDLTIGDILTAYHAERTALALNESASLNSPYFCRRNGAGFTARSVQLHLQAVRNRINAGMSDDALLPHLHPHLFRHAVGNRVANKHGLLAAMQVLGHNSPSITQRYIKPVRDTINILF